MDKHEALERPAAIEVEAIATALRECQLQHGRLANGVQIVCDDIGLDRVCGLPVIVLPTHSGCTLTEPATFNQAKTFEDVYQSEMKEATK